MVIPLIGAALVAGAKSLASGVATKVAGSAVGKMVAEKGLGSLATKEGAAAIGTGLAEKATESMDSTKAASAPLPEANTKPMNLNPSKPGKVGWDTRFYGHYLPEHFKKTSIIKTTGRVR